VNNTADVKHFLKDRTLFSHLTSEQIDFACKHIYIAYGKSGSQLSFIRSDAGITPAPGLILVRSGSLEVQSDTGLEDRLSVGDYVLIAALNNSQRVLVLEDCLYYELADFALQTLVANNNELARLINNPIKNITKVESTTVVESNQSAFVRDSMSSLPIYASPDISIQDAAILMSNNNVSSLLLLEKNNIAGIVTDKDFRNRVLAKGLLHTENVEKIMTAKPLCTEPYALLHQAQLQMIAAGIHHLPVVDNNKLVGMITLSDILRSHNLEPLSLNKGINHAVTVEDLTLVSRQIPDMVVKLIDRDARASDVGEIITSLTDAITRKLIKIAEEKFGSPPCAYAWLAFGSQARKEQMLGSDQDNGLILDDGADTSAQEYFRNFSDFMNVSLDKCGMPLCPGGIMARNDKWRLPLKGWKACFRHWIEQRSPQALLHASIFFDMRIISGNENFCRDLQKYVLSLAKGNTIFQALMCENALLHSPPLGFFKTFVLEKDGNHDRVLDLKKRGTIPIVEFARNYALSAEINVVNTIQRLELLAEKKVCSESLVANLIDAHEFIAVVRLKAQAKKFHKNEESSNFLDPDNISALLRYQLKDAFSVVREAQTAMKAKFGAGML